MVRVSSRFALQSFIVGTVEVSGDTVGRVYPSQYMHNGFRIPWVDNGTPLRKVQ